MVAFQFMDEQPTAKIDFMGVRQSVICVYYKAMASGELLVRWTLDRKVPGSNRLPTDSNSFLSLALVSHVVITSLGTYIQNLTLNLI